MAHQRNEQITLALRAKAVVRRHMLGIGATAGQETLAIRSTKIAKNLLSWPRLEGALRVGLFAAPDGVPVPDLSAVHAELRERGCLIAYPRVNFKTQDVSWGEVQDLNSLDSSGLLTKQAPSGAPTIQSGTLDIILVPVLAMDPTGVFIGDGSGVYDHALRTFNHSATVAVGFSFQMIPDAPRTARDKNVAWLVTDDRVTEARERVPHVHAVRTEALHRDAWAAKEVHRANILHRGDSRCPDPGTRRRLESEFERESRTT